MNEFIIAKGPSGANLFLAFVAALTVSLLSTRRGTIATIAPCSILGEGGLMNKIKQVAGGILLG